MRNQGLLGLHSKFKASQNYIVRLSQKQKKKKDDEDGK